MTEIGENFLLFMLANMFLLKRYDFFQLFIAKLDIDIDQDPSKLNDLPVSDNFKGNFWRLRAMFMLKNLRRLDDKQISDYHFVRITKRLELAERHYLKDDSAWGLGLTYHLFARIHSPQEINSIVTLENIQVSIDYYKKSLKWFLKCDHYRGLQMCCKSLYEI